jgi:N-acetylneuraminic acid mutarotase
MRTKSKISAYIVRGSAAALLLSCVIVALSSAINLPNKRPKVSPPENDGAFDVSGQKSAASVAASAIRRERTLTFADRVAYQRAIEEVYWRHRIWPKANAGAKPPLDKVMSQAQIEKKVEDYLRNSQALEDYWQRPITPEQLQAEMERIASHTKQPGVLRELFAALGNDPFVIAECLARPALAERLLNNLYTHDQRIHGELKQRAEAELQAHNSLEQMKQTSGIYSEIELIRSDNGDKNPGTERAVKLNSQERGGAVQELAPSFNKPDAANAPGFGVRRYSAAFESSPRRVRPVADADVSAHSRKPAASDDETLPVGALSPLQEDDAHYYAVAVMKKDKDRLKLATVAWLKEPLRSWLAKAETQVPGTMATVSANYALPVIARPSGGCIDDTWTPTSLTNAPDGRYAHTAVWTGSEMIVWGGRGYGGIGYFSTGGRYNPSTDSWTATSTTNAPAGRIHHTTVWTGSEMIIWGGYVGTIYNPTPTNTGGRYNPNTDSWIATSSHLPSAPSARAHHTAVWTGSEMIVWGGYNGSNFNTGGRYNPSSDSWTATSTINTPDPRAYHTAVWTGSEMVVWAGYNGYYLNTGGRYIPGTDSWTATSTTNAPDGRYWHMAVWAGSEMIVWGGYDAVIGYSNTGGRYNPSTDSWTATSITNAPTGRVYHTAVWNGSEMIVWGGYCCFPNHLNTGGRYNPGTDSWTVTSGTNAPDARSFHTAVWTGSQMIVWGGGNNVYIGYFNTGGRYCAGMPGPTPTPTPTPTASPTPTPSPTASPTPTPTATPICINDTWTTTSTVNAPDARGLGHTAVWTGSEMIVWGGLNSYTSGTFNTGGRYNPATDTWVATSTVNAPLSRNFHSAVWTGTEMIVWGGGNYPAGELNDGGKYNPTTDSWTGITTNNAPSARDSHTAVWTGSEMIVWGGFSEPDIWFNTGGRYNPSTDSWMATSRDAPEGRWAHTAVWTGSEMIIWGGTNQTIFLNTGGKYNPLTDRWIATSTTNAPIGRAVHTGIWSGSEMIIWGGWDINYNDLNTGGRYSPGTDSWTATSITNAPTGRAYHTAVWTGSEMIVWGGYPVTNTGGRYNTGTDSWTATSLTNAPVARVYHTAVWTGSEMIAWGGCSDLYCTNFFNTGGRYCAPPGPTPTPTPTATASPTPTSTPTPCDSGVIVNGCFETGDFTGWVIDDINATPVVTNFPPHTGIYCAFVGDPPDGFCGNPGAEANGNCSFYQQFTVPAGGGTLTFWYLTCTTDTIQNDAQAAYITDSNGGILHIIFQQCSESEAWVQQTVNMAPWAGQTVRIYFLVHEDGFGDLTGMYVDDVQLLGPSATPSPTATATSTATPNATPSATATPPATPTSTPRPTPTPRISPTPRSRPTPPPRP